MQSYSAIAKYYDSFTQNDCDYESWSQYLSDVAKAHGVKSVVDVACGTGKMTELLCKRGFDVTGVDGSAQMLAEASAKCKGRFVLQDMTKLTLPHAVDMAVCVNDGVNYLPPKKLAAFFLRVAKNLKCGAPFVFDVSSPYKLKNVVGNNVFFVDDEDVTLLWSNKLYGGHVNMSLTLFERQGQTYVRSDESHTQYLHTVREISEALAESGFRLDEVTAEYGKKLRQDSLRITFLAIKEE